MPRSPASLRRIAAILYPEAKIEIIQTPRLGAGEAGDSSARAISRVPPPVTQARPSAPDITELVLAEHVRIAKLIEQLDSALMDAAPAYPGYEPELAWAALAGFLAFHVDAAREITYLALAGTGPDTVKAIIQASETDADIRAAVEEAQLSRPGSRAWYMAVQAACSAAKSHITQVESEPLARYQGRTSAMARRALGGQWVAFMTARALDASACNRAATVLGGSATHAPHRPAGMGTASAYAGTGVRK